MPKTSLIPSIETLVWLEQAADVGCSDAIVLRHLMRRLEALENDWAQELRASHAYNEAFVEATVRRLEALEASEHHLFERVEALETQNEDDAEAWASMRRASSDCQRRLLILEAAQQQPVGYAQAVEDTLKTGIGIDNAAASAGRFVREQPAPQPTPEDAAPAAPAERLVERLQSAVRMSGGSLMDDEWQAVVCQVAEWLDLEGYVRAANDLREEVVE